MLEKIKGNFEEIMGEPRRYFGEFSLVRDFGPINVLQHLRHW